MDLDRFFKMAGISKSDTILESPLVKYLAPTVPLEAAQLVLTEESWCKGPSHQYDAGSYSIPLTRGISQSRRRSSSLYAGLPRVVLWMAAWRWSSMALPTPGSLLPALKFSSKP